MAYLDKQIRVLPYAILSKLAEQLDMTGPRNWKALINVMPTTAYKPEQVRLCELNIIDHFIFLRFCHS